MKVCENWKKYKIVPAALFAAAYIFLVWYKSGIYFETNDDRYIASILSGVITGSPNAHVYHINFLLAFPVAVLYQIFNIIPWYGMMLMGLQWISYMGILNSIYARCVNYIQIAAATIMTGVFCMSYYYMLGELEFTSTAMLLAMSGYFVLFLHRDDKTGKCLILFFLFELFALLLRAQAMLIIQPMGAAVWIGLNMPWNKKDIVRKAGDMASVFVLLAGTLFVSVAGNAVGGYYGTDWRLYKEYNDYRVELFDYSGKPDYSSVKEVLDKYGVTEAQYNAYLDYTVINSYIPNDCEKELAEYAAKGEYNHISDALNGIKSIYLEDNQWNMNRFSICAFIALIILIIVYRKYYLLIPSLGLAAAQVLTWGVLFYRGRVLMRVTVPVFACSALLPMALAIECIRGNYSRRKNILRGTAVAVCCAVLIFTGFYSARQQYRYVHEVNEGQSIFMEGMYEIIAYCEAHEDNRYILESVSMGNYKGSALENGIYHPSNYVFSGGWFSNMPDVKEHMESYLNEKEDMYLIIYSDQNEAEHPSVKYLEEYTGNDAEAVDTIVTSPGVIYTVYRFYCTKAGV
jgi:hypothetical protein